MDNNELVKALRILDDDCKNLECKNCPRNKYRKFSSRKGCCDGVNLSAADTIEQLTAQLAEQSVEISSREEASIAEHVETHYWRDSAKRLQTENAELKQQLADVAADRDAAVYELHQVCSYIGDCSGCKWYENKKCTNEVYLVTCSGKTNDHWEWRGKQSNGWISVKDRLPNECGKYLTCDKLGNIHTFDYSTNSKYPFYIRPDNNRYFMPTHWQPLPQPPKEDKPCHD